MAARHSKVHNGNESVLPEFGTFFKTASMTHTVFMKIRKYQLHGYILANDTPRDYAKGQPMGVAGIFSSLKHT